MKSIAAAIAFLVVIGSCPESARAQDHANRDFSTVKLYFINQWLPEPHDDQSNQMAGGMGGGMNRFQKFDTAHLILDGEFIGNAMFRFVDVMPTLNLEAGKHSLVVKCDGYQPFETTFNVLRNGSTQWLVIRLKPTPRVNNDKPSPETK